MINSLSQVSKLRVVSRSTVFRYKGKQNAPVKSAKNSTFAAWLREE